MVHKHIERLVNEEYSLDEKGILSEADGRRLKEIKIDLDRYWDLSHQDRRPST